ncbi:hypothetical protein KKB44_06470 [Candidatus Micrarchaeota archaeon]|nr:hypothetical protein [Candidatus Micrarchaeota archaeon]
MEVFLPLLVSLPASAGVMIGVSLAFGIFVVGVMYLVAYLMQSPPMSAIANEELAAFLFTVFIVFFWLGFDSVLNGITLGLLASALPHDLSTFLSPTYLSDLSINHLNLAIASLDIISKKLIAQYSDLYLFEALIGFLSTVTFPLGSPVPAVNVISFSLAPFTGLALLSNAHTTIVEAIGYIITVVWAKEFILVFARDAVPILLLPLGIVLRASPLFRKTGSSIIALAFALYFVFPFAVLLSNYLIFDVYQPADFAYTPVSSSYLNTEKSSDNWQAQIEEGRRHAAEEILDQFQAPDVVELASDSPDDECSGNFIIRMLCSIKNIITTAFTVVGSFISTVFTIWWFMIGMTGDFFMSGFNNPLLPASASAGLYYFIIREVTTISPFIILIIFTTVVEIVITVTMYRNISLLIGGEAELIGMTKIV